MTAGMLMRWLTAGTTSPGSSEMPEASGESMVGNDCKLRANPVSSESRQDEMSHMIVRMEVVRDSLFVGTAMKNLDTSLSSPKRTFAIGSGADAGESKIKHV